jgi:hypothetical protein
LSNTCATRGPILPAAQVAGGGIIRAAIKGVVLISTSAALKGIEAGAAKRDAALDNILAEPNKK